LVLFPRRYGAFLRRFGIVDRPGAGVRQSVTVDPSPRTSYDASFAKDAHDSCMASAKDHGAATGAAERYC
jgi:hypothetical protein